MQWEDVPGSAIAGGISAHCLDPSRQVLFSEYTSIVTLNTTRPDIFFRTKHYFLIAAMAHTTGMVSGCDLSATAMYQSLP